MRKYIEERGKRIWNRRAFLRKPESLLNKGIKKLQRDYEEDYKSSVFETYSI